MPAPDTLPSTLQLPGPGRATREQRTLQLLRDARWALAGALAALEETGPDRELSARIKAWHVVGGVPFRHEQQQIPT